MKESYVYITSNINRTVLYIGLISNIKLRIEQHKNGVGSKFTSNYSVSDLLYFETFTTIELAIQREKQLKNWHSDWKWNLIKEKNRELKGLSKGL